MLKQFQPMLAASAGNDLMKLKFPLYASPKLDGIRAVVRGGVLLSRNLKPIPNEFLQLMFGHREYNGLDGELICGDPCSPTCFRDTSSAVMSVKGVPNVCFFVFDDFSEANTKYYVRMSSAHKRVKEVLREELVFVTHELVSDPIQLNALEQKWIGQGFEGLMINGTDSSYKFGRSTLKEGTLLKLKRFMDGEAVIIDIEERMHNANEAEKDNLGRTKRSSHKAGKEGRGDLGALLVRDLKTKVEFSVGSGFSDVERQQLWNEGVSRLHGKVITYRYFPSGSKDKPRFPTFVGFRNKIDL